MHKLSGNQQIEYLHRSYAAVDGLWFMKMEEKFGFETALEIDRQVWEVLPKIQARKLKGLLGASDNLQGLSVCLKNKLEIDGFEYIIQSEDNSHLYMVVRRCPWYDLMVKSGRVSLAGRVGDVVCGKEYAVWATEFGVDIKFELAEQICKGAGFCRFKFSTLP